jgi:hypothetical protein
MLNQEKPLWMPSGSVRSIIALGVVAAYIFGQHISSDIVTLVLGAYFLDRASNGTAK